MLSCLSPNVIANNIYGIHVCVYICMHVCGWERILLRAILTFNVCIYVFLHIPFCYSVNCITMGFSFSSYYLFCFCCIIRLAFSRSILHSILAIYCTQYIWIMRPKLQYFAYHLMLHFFYYYVFSFAYINFLVYVVFFLFCLFFLLF